LKAYKERGGHCRVPRTQKEAEFPLGQWALLQRVNKGLSEERRRRLDELGFAWDLRAAAWEEGFSYLKAYKAREGHCRVSRGQKENNFPLGSWVTNQRDNKNLPEEYRRRLDVLVPRFRFGTINPIMPLFAWRTKTNDERQRPGGYQRRPQTSG
jgi:hypothetical protein